MNKQMSEREVKLQYEYIVKAEREFNSIEESLLNIANLSIKYAKKSEEDFFKEFTGGMEKTSKESLNGNASILKFIQETKKVIELMALTKGFALKEEDVK